MKKILKYSICFAFILFLLFGVNFAVKNKIITLDLSYFKNDSNNEDTNINNLEENNSNVQNVNSSSEKKEEVKPSSSSKKKTESKSSSSSKKIESKPSSSKPIIKATIDLYYRPGCSYCNNLINFLSSLDSETKSKFILKKHNIEDNDIYDEFMNISMKIDGEQALGVPYAVFNGKEAINGFNDEYEHLYLSYIDKYSK